MLYYIILSVSYVCLIFWWIFTYLVTFYVCDTNGMRMLYDFIIIRVSYIPNRTIALANLPE